MEKEKEIREGIKAIAESIVDWETEFKNFEQLYDSFSDSVYAYLEQEFPEEAENWEKWIAGLDLEEMLRKSVYESFFDDGVEAIGYAIGVQHNKHHYHLEYVVEFDRADVDKEDVKEALEEEGITPHAWGVVANYDDWANYWFGVLTREQLTNGEEIDPDLLTVLATQSNYQLISPDRRSGLSP